MREASTGDYPGLITGEWILAWTFDGGRVEVVGGVDDRRTFRVIREVGVRGHSGILGVADEFADDGVLSVVWGEPRACGHHRYAVTSGEVAEHVLLEFASGLREVGG